MKYAILVSIVLMVLKLLGLLAISWWVVVAPVLVSFVIGMALFALAGLVAILAFTK